MGEKLENEQDVVLLTYEAKVAKLYIRASPATICILANHKASFYILPTTFSIKRFIFSHSLSSLNIIFEVFLFYFIVFLNRCFIISPPLWIPPSHSRGLAFAERLSL
jgi:hypothetical protein